MGLQYHPPTVSEGGLFPQKVGIFLVEITNPYNLSVMAFHYSKLKYINIFPGDAGKKRTHGEASQDGEHSKRPKKVVGGNKDNAAIEDTVAAQAYAATKSVKKAVKRLSRHVSPVNMRCVK